MTGSSGSRDSSAEGKVCGHLSPRVREGFKVAINLFATAIGFAWGVFVFYIVIGYITEGKTALSSATLSKGANQALNICIFILLLITIATLEGFAFSITTLKLQDLQSVANQYPTAARVHKFVYGTAFHPASPKRLDNILMGRQVILIIVVFISSKITSFPAPLGEAKWPWTDRVISDSWDWFIAIFLNSGICGGFFVVWIAQLSAVLIATRNPPAMLNLPQMNLVPYACLLVQKAGLTWKAAAIVAVYNKMSNPPVPLKSRNQVLEETKLAKNGPNAEGNIEIVEDVPASSV
jgi:hypothetical protein